jgi:hypothetical protein
LLIRKVPAVYYLPDGYTGGKTLSEWHFAQQEATDELCILQHFSMKKRQPSGDVEFLITVKEFITPPYPNMRFFAQSDKQTNQSTTPFTPSGWGATLLTALAECIRAVHRFPYEPQGEEKS